MGQSPDPTDHQGTPGRNTLKIFTPDAVGTLIDRPNRFIVNVQLPEGPVRAHCPNPGRLIELMNPGRTMILEKGKDPERKTAWTLAAAVYKGQTVSLFSARANSVTGELIIPRLFPEAEEIKAEYRWGNSRFDWHFRLGGKEIFMEVKACTLIEEGVAMFPDAPSDRASRHLKELAEIAATDPSRECHVVFVIMNRETRTFIPNLHTDPVFARTVHEVSPYVHFHGVSTTCTAEGELSLISTEIPVMTDLHRAAEENSGIYMIMAELEEESITVGSLGEMNFQRGFYIYAGSAARNLKSRVARHMRKRKKKRWHIDYLLASAVKVKDFPVYTEKDLECPLAEDLKKLSDRIIPGFGCSDCRCDSHLFYFKENPLQNRDFLDLLFHYRHSLAF